jgi:signal transduction histidine kinase/DNA-binding response OmpR family regulator
LIAEALFAAVFARVLASYLRRRDLLQRDVAIMFSTLAVLFVLEVLRQTVGQPPQLVRSLATVLLAGQPFLMLRVVRRLAPVPAPVYWLALAGWIVTAVPVMVVAGPLGVWLLPVVAVFVVTEISAAFFLARLARERIGAPRARLWLAAAGTVLFAVAIMTLGAAAAAAERADDVRQAGRLIALASAIAFVTAFTPPAWARRAWSSRAAYGVVRRLLQVPADAPPEAIWQSYAESVRQATGAGGVVVLAGSAGPGVREVARVDVPAPHDDPAAPGGWDALPPGGTLDTAKHVPPAARPAAAYAHAAGTRFVTVAPVELPTGPGVLLLFNAYRSLFTDDDVQLLGDLVGHAGALAQRGELLTERGHLTGELSDSVAALTAAGKAKSEFLANMSHELRTPLNAIIGFSELMRAEPATNGQTAVPAEWIEHIHSSGQHLVGLINEVLDLAKIEAGKIELRQQSLDLPEVVGEVVTSLASLSQRKNLDLTVAVPHLRVHADRVRLRQIVTNLLSNAIKFTPDGGQVFISARRIGPDIAISVADTGPGIAPADQQRVFEEFQQAGDQEAGAGGTGLGLALTRRLVEAHGGRIELESAVGHGAKFTVHLPGAEVAAPELDPVPGTTAGVLIIEDDDSAAQLMATYLTKAGYQVRIAPTGEQGLATARACHPEVILLDIKLPGIDGWQVLGELKRDGQLRHVPVAIVSVLDDAEVGVALGAVDYFVKPVDRGALLGWLARRGLIPPTHSRDITVLAIDDDAQTLQLVEATLRAEGMAVVCAAGGVEGLRAARSVPVDLIICDLLMTDVDGFDVIAALHDDPATRDVPVVALTAHTLTAADRARLNGKVITVTAKDGTPGRMPELARTVGEMTGWTLARDSVKV